MKSSTVYSVRRPPRRQIVKLQIGRLSAPVGGELALNVDGAWMGAAKSNSAVYYLSTLDIKIWRLFERV